MNDRINRLLEAEARNGSDYQRQRAAERREVVESLLQAARRRQERRHGVAADPIR